MDADHAYLSFVSLDELQTPTNGSQVLVDKWWTVHPEKGAVFYQKYSPQCNANSKIQEMLGQKLYPWAEAVFLHVAYIPARHIPTEF